MATSGSLIGISSVLLMVKFFWSCFVFGVNRTTELSFLRAFLGRAVQKKKKKRRREEEEEEEEEKKKKKKKKSETRRRRRRNQKQEEE